MVPRASGVEISAECRDAGAHGNGKPVWCKFCDKLPHLSASFLMDNQQRRPRISAGILRLGSVPFGHQNSGPLAESKLFT